MTSYEAIKLDVADGVGVITLNRPERMNAWNQTMGDEVGNALTACNDDDAIRAVVITGAGRAFCAGADLRRGEDTFAGREQAGPDTPAPRAVLPHQIDKPVVAAINGAAVGVGITMPMLCDLRFVAEDAKVSFAFVRRGMIPELASHLVVQRVAGFAAAADVLLSGRMLRGQELAEMGLANAALPASQVLTRALEWARDIANSAPASVAITKRLLWEGMAKSVDEMLDREAPLFAWAGNQPDAKEGIKSFVEKRAPEWKLSVPRDLPDKLYSR